MDFTFEAYRAILMHLVENGYDIASYTNYQQVDKPCILRHDVDYSLDKAVAMSSVEVSFKKDMSMDHSDPFSTYFILLTGCFYNVHSKSALAALSSILEHGNEIGLHFDQRVYETGDSKAIVEYAENEAFLLGKILGRPVSAVSFHCPARGILDENIRFDTLINAYSGTFFGEFKYISDSSMRWREDPLAVIGSGQHQKLHILTHAFWYSEKEETKEEKVSNFIKAASTGRLEAYCADEPYMREILTHVK